VDLDSKCEILPTKSSYKKKTATMYYLTLICLLMVPLIMAGPWSNENLREMNAGEEYNDEAEAFDHPVERREFCARWGDNCVPEAKVKFAKCCPGMRCDCGSALLGGGKCQCKKESVFGR
jgi:hypothetical protein